MGNDEILSGLARAVDVVARLRGEGGCPWDREQTHRSLRQYAIEEAHEVVEAIDGGDAKKLREELGDLLFQVLLHAQLARESGAFDLGEVAAGLADKLVRRHPHVFGGPKAPDAAAVEARWEEHKRAEREAARSENENENENEAHRSLLEGIPRSLPALARAHKVQERAARHGFDWARREDVLEKLDEERGEVARALADGSSEAIEHEIGDLLFTVVNLARKCKVNSEDVLRGAIQRFTDRFERVEAGARAAGRALKTMSLQEMDQLWEAAKRAMP